jgi:hypothetical protein
VTLFVGDGSFGWRSQVSVTEVSGIRAPEPLRRREVRRPEEFCTQEPSEAVNGRPERLRGSVIDVRDPTRNIVSSLIETGDFGLLMAHPTS